MEMTYKEHIVRKHWITLMAITEETRKFFPAAMISLGVTEGVMGADKTSWDISPRHEHGQEDLENIPK